MKIVKVMYEGATDNGDIIDLNEIMIWKNSTYVMAYDLENDIWDQIFSSRYAKFDLQNSSYVTNFTLNYTGKIPDQLNNSTYAKIRVMRLRVMRSLLYAHLTLNFGLL